MGRLIKISTKGMTREDWLEERRKAIGGSDAGAIIGLNPYSTPFTVWADKTGRLPEKEDNEAMRQGRDLEQYVADRFTELSGKKTRKVNAIIKNPEYPWASANIDREVFGFKEGLECKTTSVLNLKRFRDGEFPATYYAQAVHYLAVTNYRRWYVAVLVLNRGFMVYQLTRFENDDVPEWCESSVFVSDAEITALMDAERDFWELVKSDTPPALNGTEGESTALGAIYTGGGEEVVDLVGLGNVLQQHHNLKVRIKDLETDLARCEQTIKAALGNNERGQTGGFVVNWKRQNRRTFDVKAFAEACENVDLDPFYKTTIYRKFEIKSIDT